MSAPTPGTDGTWTVTGQRETQELPPGAQNFVRGLQITFTTGHNVTSSVFVPYSNYTAAYVQQLIAARVAQLDAVSTLTHATEA